MQTWAAVQSRGYEVPGGHRPLLGVKRMSVGHVNGGAEGLLDAADEVIE